LNHIQNTIFIGAGNVATHLALALKNADVNILQVYSRTENAALILAKKVSAASTSAIREIDSEADLYIISVVDNALEALISQLELNDKLVVHTSGSVQMDLLKKTSENYGVFYPLQTFSITKDVEIKNIPICIEANNDANLQKLNELAKRISDNVQFVNSDQRKVLHLAAVFACNFPNFMFTISEKIAKQANIDFDILRPLIKETAEKVMEINPMDAQTGPAKRNDQKIMDEHLKMLSEFPEFQKIYKLISSEIQNNQQQETSN